MTMNQYSVAGMTCSHCENAVLGEVQKIAGVEHVDVSAAAGTLVITSASPLDDDAVLAAVSEAGYAAARV